ncbi:SDR family oxidoreductase [Brevibacterium jeotgali]|uniref:NAD(P)H-binding n=1 Tax=Brevibacterium jeotgali TaxID=1262550 RepID=A0A2H1L802_9MICO|nr:SDR family oxidoreductase [Brevibacterium jeotgali]TWC03431.1 putative NAD(P)-binding protein [Brevibacterium jeotgali]SMY12860.1 NAD(P)H-binding [Brevibacterium jeotgali]
MADKKAVIIGAHGKIALLAAPRLVDAGYDVDGLIRDSGQSDEITAAGARPVVLDIEDAGVDELAQAFDGADAVVFSAGAGGGNPARTEAVDHKAAVRAMDAAQKAGVSRFVMVSFSSALVAVDTVDPENPFFAYAKAKHDADEYLRSTKLDYTILGPGKLTLEPASEKIVVADKDGRVDGLDAEAAVTSRDNVAVVIAHVLEKDAGMRQTVNFFDGDTPIAQAIS